MDKFQWFILTVIGGKEDSIISTVKEKIRNFGYEDLVKEIKVFKEKIEQVDVFSKYDPNLPKSLKNTKTTKWETLPDGKYRRTKTKIINKYPGYVFINMIMNSQIWYTIRNTNGVLGFVGSSGKGSMPIPISIEEYEKVSSVKQEQPVETKEDIAEEKQVIYTTDLVVGDNVSIISGAFEGTEGVIKSLNIHKGTANVEIEIFGRTTEATIGFSELKRKE